MKVRVKDTITHSDVYSPEGRQNLRPYLGTEVEIERTATRFVVIKNTQVVIWRDDFFYLLKCANNNGYEGLLTKDMTYEGRSVDDMYFVVKDDRGEEAKYSKKRFKHVN